MNLRFTLPALLLGFALTLAGCTNSLVDSIAVTPTSQSLTIGQTVQFTATGTYGHGSNHPATTQNITSQVTWSSSAPSVASINSSGLATALAAGTTTITATMNGFTGVISASATLTVNGSSGTVTNADITALTIIPASQSVASPGGTAQFLPIGTTSAGASVNLSGQVAWSSSSAQIATINASTGMATAVSQGAATMTAVYTNSDGTVATGTATFQVLAGNAEQVTALTMFPTSQAATAQAQQSQFTVLGTENGLQYDVTGQVAWTSSNLAVATIGTAGNGTPGLATAVGAGTTTIAATFTNKDGSQIVATATYSVTLGAAQEPLLSINIVPAATTVSAQGMTGQYLAFGTYSTAPTVRDITNEVTWISLLPEVASINSGGTSGELAGLATAQGATGNTVIYAEDTKSNPDGTVVLSNAQTFTCKDPQTNVCDPGPVKPQFVTVTIYIAGENSTAQGEYVTAPSDTGTPNLIHCGPDWTGAGGQVCTGTYAYSGTNPPATLTLTENLPAGSPYFGGWSSGSGCEEADPQTSTTCTIPLNGNATVGAIFY